ncbi:MAG: DUF4974 domain-containing protein [Bacteroidales bacterium]
MTKELLLKFIKGVTSQVEEAQVLSWVSKCKENKEYYIVLKNLWLSQNLSNDAATERELNEIRALTTHKTEAIKERNISRRLVFYKWSFAVASVLLLISVSLNMIDFDIFIDKVIETPNVVSLASVPANQKNFYYTVKGAKARLELPDGSVVWLNSDSKITYPCRFEGDTREVEISGEALFEVVKNKNIPMVVSTNKNFKIKVYGTTFNVRSYDNDIKAVATLFNGKIDIITHNKKGEETIIGILPNQVYEIEDKTPDKPILKPVDNIIDEIAWHEGRLIFDNTPLSDVIKSLERWHGTIFEVKDASILDYTITATFRSESIVQIMEMLKFCTLIDYTADKNKVVLRERK